MRSHLFENFLLIISVSHKPLMETYAQSKVYFDNDQICMAYLRVPIPSMALVDQKKHQIAHYLMQKNIEIT